MEHSRTVAIPQESTIRKVPTTVGTFPARWTVEMTGAFCTTPYVLVDSDGSGNFSIYSIDGTDGKQIGKTVHALPGHHIQMDWNINPNLCDDGFNITVYDYDNQTGSSVTVANTETGCTHFVVKHQVTALSAFTPDCSQLSGPAYYENWATYRTDEDNCLVEVNDSTETINSVNMTYKTPVWTACGVGAVASTFYDYVMTSP
jgi:hypothetical protein